MKFSSVGFTGGVLGEFLNVVTCLTLLILDLVLDLCYLGISTLVPVFIVFFHFWDIIGL